MFYQPPSSHILTDTANVNGSERIYNQEQIAAALTGWGLSCRAVAVDTAPQVLTYHFDLDNVLYRAKVKKFIPPLSALLRCKIAEQSSQKGHFALSMPRPERATVSFKRTLLDKQYNTIDNPLSACIGYDTANNPVISSEIVNLTEQMNRTQKKIDELQRHVLREQSENEVYKSLLCNLYYLIETYCLYSELPNYEQMEMGLCDHLPDRLYEKLKKLREVYGAA